MKPLEKRRLCQWGEEELRAHLEEIAQVVGRPRFVCARCGRAARRKRNLCDPVRLKKGAAG